MLAIYLLGTGTQGLQLAGGQLWVTDAFNGVALIGAVSLALLLQRRRGRREKQADGRWMISAAVPAPRRARTGRKDGCGMNADALVLINGAGPAGLSAGRSPRTARCSAASFC